MRRNDALVLIVCLLSGNATVACRTAPEGSKLKGVVVEEVGEGTALERAGIRPGDVLLSWERLPNPPANPEAARGEVASIFDWLWLEIEQAPRGMVVLTGRQGDRVRRFEVTPGVWEGKVRPQMSNGPLAGYLQGLEYLESGDAAATARVWGTAAAKAQDRLVRGWLWLRLGDLWRQQRHWQKTHQAYDSALGEDLPSPHPSFLWQAVGVAYQNQGELGSAHQAYTRSREIRATAWGARSLAVAESLRSLGSVAWDQGDLELAEELSHQTVSIRRELAPQSLAVAESLSDQGYCAAARGAYQEARDLQERALEIAQRLAPESRQTASYLNALGEVLDDIGDLDRAETLYRRALRIRQQRMPGSLAVAASINNLAVIAYKREDLDQAMDYHQQVLAIREKLAAGSLGVAFSLNNLGTVAWKRGQLSTASDYYERSLEILERTSPDSLATATLLSNLGLLSFTRGDLDQAATYLQQSIEQQTELAPDSLEMATKWNNLGLVLQARGELEPAEDYLERAYRLRHDLAPDSLSVANSLHNLGNVVLQREDFHRARSLHERALAIRQATAPASLQLARSLHALGRLHYRSNPPRYSAADEYFNRALRNLEHQFSRLGGSHDVRAGFRVQYHEFYRDALEVQLELGKKNVAFHTLERSRARSFLEHLAERDTIFTADIPEELDRERRDLAVLYDRTQQQLSELHPRNDPELVDELQERLRQLRSQADDIEEKIRRASPRLAALQYPRPLDVDATCSALDPGTLLLSYSIGENTSSLFAVSNRKDLLVYSLAIGETELRQKIEDFREKVHGRAWHRRKASRIELAKQLYNLLMEPAEDAIRRSDRLLIVPDGPLHLLPFAALVRDTPGDTEHPWQYLVEWKPLHTALSATVFAELKHLRNRPGSDNGGSKMPVLLAAFGDPEYPRELRRGRREDVAGAIQAEGLESVPDAYVRAAAERGFDFPPLPYARQEVQQIAQLYPGARIYLGAEATEERAKSAGKDLRILHFATHGTLDHYFPLHSAVALTIPREVPEGRDNGLLQAWEIFESVRINADLVVLSACESGLGQELGGEGLIGLTRAFQYAGARSVAATLWNVSDQTTAVLMQRFYRHLKAGKPKDEALRAAQIELIRGAIDASAPYYWAAFQIYGDWK